MDKNLIKFQYTAFIKTVHILLPNYKYLHTTSNNNEESYVGRDIAQKRLLNYLRNGGKKGTYLITGYRGMGKTTLVNKVVNRYKDENKDKIHVINISFGQKNLTEHDILKQVIHEIKNIIDSRYDPYRISFFKFLKSPIFVFIISAIVFLYIVFHHAKTNSEEVAIKTEKKEVSSKKGETIRTRLDTTEVTKTIKPNTNPYDTGKVVSQVLIALVFGILTFLIWNNIIFAFFTFRKTIIKRKVNFLYDRCTTQYSIEENVGTGTEQIPLLFSRKKSKSFPIAGTKEISNELIHLLKEISAELKAEFVFIFDELDKIDNTFHQTPHYEDTELLDMKGETISFNDNRKRKKLVLDILSSLKYLITEAEAKFIFIAGSEMFDAALADVSDKHSAISSIFGHTINVDSLYKDKASDEGVGITNLIENFLVKLIDPNKKNESQKLLYFKWLSEYNLSNEDELKIMYTLQHFINYLAYRSTGSPKKMIRIIEEHTMTLNQKDINTNKKIIAYSNKSYSNKYKREDCVYLSLGYKEQYKIGLLNYFYRPIILSKSRIMKNYSDNLLVTIPYLLDHIHKFHRGAFSMENLELLPEVLSTNRAPELQMFLEELIELFKQNLIRKTETKFFDYKFNFKIYNEIVYVSSLFAEESAAYNFTLDENYNIKIYLRLKIKELRNIYKDFIGGETASSSSLDSIALFNILLGDISYFDREYSDAIGSYLDAIIAIQNDYNVNDKEKNKALSINNLHFISFIKCLMKLGLSYEKIKSYDKAIACYLDVIEVIGKYDTIESKYINRAEKNRYLINALFACLFIFEKQPALGGFRKLFTEVYKINLNNYNNVTNVTIKFRDFLFNNPIFYTDLSLLTFYRNSKEDKEIVKEFSLMKGLSNTNKLKNNDIPIILAQHSLLFDFNTDDMKDVVNALYSGYIYKSLNSGIAFNAARNLSRIGNVYLSNYKIGNIKSDLENIIASSFRKVKKIIEEVQSSENYTTLIKKHTYFCSILGSSDEFNQLKNSLRKKSYEDLNASDKIKIWLLILKSGLKFDDNNILEEVSLKNIFCLYLLSAKLYMFSNKALMASHQYRKILAILRKFSKNLKEIKDPKIDDFLKFIEDSLVKRNLQVASWMSSNTDRSQVYKYKYASNIDSIHHPKQYSKYNYKNTSNAADIKEAYWHFICIKEIVTPKEDTMPLNVFEKNENQSFVNQANMIHTMHARLNELDVQCVINKTLLDNIIRIIQIEFNIDKIYGEIRKGDNSINIDSLTNIINHIKSNTEKSEALIQLPILISNWIFCLHNMIQIMQTKGHSFLITYSTLADQYRRLGDILKYFEICKSIRKFKDDFPDVEALTKELIGEDNLKSMDTTSLYQLASRNYRLAISAHERGDAYRHLISNMFFLEDDFHDNIFHFSISFERHRINSNEIIDKIRNLNQELNKSQFFDYESHINNTSFQNNK